MRKSGELLKCGKHQDLQVRILWFFVAEKRLQRLFKELLQFFCCGRLCGIPPDPLIARMATARSQLNIAY